MYHLPMPVLLLSSIKSSTSASVNCSSTTAWNKLTPISYWPLSKRAVRVTVASWWRHDSWRFWCWVEYQVVNVSMELWSCGVSLKSHPSLSKGYGGHADSVRTLAVNSPYDESLNWPGFLTRADWYALTRLVGQQRYRYVLPTFQTPGGPSS